MCVAVAFHQRLAFRKFQSEGVVLRRDLQELLQPRFDARIFDLVTQAAASETSEGSDATQQREAADARRRNAATGGESDQGAVRAGRCQQAPAQAGRQCAADFLNPRLHELAHFDEVFRAGLYLASNAFARGRAES